MTTPPDTPVPLPDAATGPVLPPIDDAVGHPGPMVTPQVLTAASDATDRHRPSGGPQRPTAPNRGHRRLLWVAAITTGYALILLLRRPSGLSDPTIWAEDGGVFIAGSFDSWGQLLTTYAGQTWVLQRLIAGVIGQLPAPWWPSALYVTSCVGAALAAAVVLSERVRPLLGRFRFRVLAGALLVLLPGIWEVQGNLANLHWWAIAAAMVLLATEAPRTGLGRVAELTLIVVVAFTGLGGVLLLPVAIWRLLARRDAYLLARSGVIAVAAAVQVVLTFTLTDRGNNDAVAALPTFLEFLLKRIGGGLLLGERLLDRLWVAGPWLVPLAVLALTLLGLILALAVIDWRGPSWAWLATGVLCVGLATVATPADRLASTLAPYVSGRYALLLLAAVVLVVVRALSVGGQRRRWVAAAALVLMVSGVVGDAVLPPLAPGIARQDLGLMQSCLDAEPRFADAPFCYVPTQPEAGNWKVLVQRS